MIKGTPELIAGRRDEIMKACETLYRTMSFREITLKEIGALITCSRPSIYNYFQTKEEIFLALFEREYLLWTEALNAIAEEGTLPPEQLADRLAASLQARALMLKLLSVNLYDMEENSRMERLVDFKKAYGAAVAALDRLIARSLPEQSGATRRETVVSVLLFTHGLYPYAFATEKQLAAMNAASVPYESRTIEELARYGLKKLLK